MRYNIIVANDQNCHGDDTIDAERDWLETMSKVIVSALNPTLALFPDPLIQCGAKSLQQKQQHLQFCPFQHAQGMVKHSCNHSDR